MDDLKFGTRDKRGDWAPKAALGISPLFRLPPNPVKVLKWLPSYLLPWNMLFMATGALFWSFLFPDVATMKVLHWGWVLQILALNLGSVTLFYSALELRLYILRRQSNQFKYNAKFPSDARNDAFWFGSQNLEGALRSLGTGVPIWTGFQVLIAWAFASGYVPWMTFSNNFWYLLLLGFCVPIWHEFHFFCIHRLIHTPFLYKYVHSVHHNSVNPSPWSSLSMHPLEQFLYFTSSLLHLIIPSNPVVALYQLHYSGFGAVVGHIGFDKIKLADEAGFDTHAYAHYLHHKYFEVNYGDGLMPLDRLFGSWHDGTPESDARMAARFRKKVEKANRKVA